MAVMPTLQMSALVLYPSSLLSITSGAIQYGVPTNVRRRKPSVPVSCPLTPKSEILTSPAPLSSTFAALMSRWMRASPWR